MRVPFTTINRHMQNVIRDRFADLASVQEQLATGKRLLRPSDDPVDVANDLNFRSRTMQLKQFHANIEDGLGFMTVTDTAMMSLNTLMQRSRELAVQGSTGTLSVDQRAYIYKETEQLFRQVVSVLNTQYKGEYIFAGRQTKTTPFPMHESSSDTMSDYTNYAMAYYDGSAGTGNAYRLRMPFDPYPIENIVPGTFSIRRGGTTFTEGVDYTIDYVNGTITPLNAALAVDVSDAGTFGANGPAGTNFYESGSVNQVELSFEYIGHEKDIYGNQIAFTGDIYREIETNIAVPVNITPEELTRDETTGIGLLDTFIRFGDSLLQSNTAGIENAIGEIDTVFKTLLEVQSKNGARINRFDTTLTRNEAQHTETTRLQSELEDADFAEMASRFKLLETVYNAALQSAANVIQPSLVNFL